MNISKTGFVAIVAVLATTGILLANNDSAPVACTMEYAPVCASVQVQCIKAPCPPINQTFGNRCTMRANSLAKFLYDGECKQSDTTTTNTQANMANPASVNCEKKGGTLEIKDAEGGQVGICHFTNGVSCEERAFFRGECKAVKDTITKVVSGYTAVISGYNEINAQIIRLQNIRNKWISRRQNIRSESTSAYQRFMASIKKWSTSKEIEGK